MPALPYQVKRTAQGVDALAYGTVIDTLTGRESPLQVYEESKDLGRGNLLASIKERSGA